jgi:hypothetical protein
MRCQLSIEPHGGLGLDEYADILGGSRVAVVHDGDPADQLEIDLSILEQAPHLGERDVDSGKLGAHRSCEAAQACENVGSRVNHLTEGSTGEGPVDPTPPDGARRRGRSRPQTSLLRSRHDPVGPATPECMDGPRADGHPARDAY